MNLLVRTIKAGLLLAQVLVLGVCVWVALEARRTASIKPRPVLVDIEKGWGVRTIAATLKKEGVLTKKTLFIVRYRLFYHGAALKAGQYEMSAPSTPQSVLEALNRGLVYLRPVTVAEGLTAQETFPLFREAGFGAEKDFVKAAADTSALGLLDPLAADLEGYLFPETYRLPRGITAPEILSGMVDQFRAVFTETWRRRAAALGFSVRDAVILASLIEKETGRPEEKPLVSSVFHNRLRKGMKLDCDPTIIYALKKAGTYDGKLHGKDLRFDSPYNTYLHAGLPPGPICNPGRASLDAALHPAETEFLYFVARQDGSHQFSRTFGEHNRAVDEYRRRPAASIASR
jgi:UPF0755 protein